MIKQRLYSTCHLKKGKTRDQEDYDTASDDNVCVEKGKHTCWSTVNSHCRFWAHITCSPNCVTDGTLI